MKPVPKIERAIQLVMLAFADKKRIGPTSVPASTHSLRVGLALISYGYPIEVVLAGFCHDLLEDTDVTCAMIEHLFSPRVAYLTEACTLKPELGDTPPGEDELHSRVVGFAEVGDVEPLIVKCADSGDNLKTNAHLKPEWQVPAYYRGMQWLEAGEKFLPGAAVVEDLAVILGREKIRLVF